MIRLGVEHVVPLVNLLNECMLEEPLIHCDETRLQVLKSDKAPTADHWMWVRAAGPPGRRIVLFDYDPSRGGAVPKRLLEGFGGTLLTDGYEAYANVAASLGLQHAGCWAHVRRKFDEARKAQPAQSTTGGHAAMALEMIRELYVIERTLWRRDPPITAEHRVRVRRSTSPAAAAENRTMACALLGPVIKERPTVRRRASPDGVVPDQPLRFRGGRAVAGRGRCGSTRRTPALHALMGGSAAEKGPTRFADPSAAIEPRLPWTGAFASAAVGLAGLLNQLGRAAEAHELTAPFAAPPERAGRRAGGARRGAEASRPDARRRSADRPGESSPRAASTPVSTGRTCCGSSDATRSPKRPPARPSPLLGDAPGAHVVHARTLHELGRYDEAEAACRHALTRAPLDDRAHGHLAELIRRRTGDRPPPRRRSIPCSGRLRPGPGDPEGQAAREGRPP